MSKQRHNYLKRLPREHYLGRAYVHWSLTMQDRATGWLTPSFYYKFRELKTHTMFRYGITCPVFCCMPDHLHLMWLGLFDGTDQLNAMKFFRRQLNGVLGKIGFQLQSQSYDNVLREKDLEDAAFEETCEYIARNPERKNLVPPDRYMDYRMTDCLVPGAPELRFFDKSFWDSFWRIYSATTKNGLMRLKT